MLVQIVEFPLSFPIPFGQEGSTVCLAASGYVQWITFVVWPENAAATEHNGLPLLVGKNKHFHALGRFNKQT